MRVWVRIPDTTDCEDDEDNSKIQTTKERQDYFILHLKPT